MLILGLGSCAASCISLGASIEDPSALEVAYPAGVVSVVTTAVGLVMVFVGALLKAISSKER